jgi:glyoxylase-like metal-dependent hydrolase (beta-lactamase superfamily II)
MCVAERFSKWVFGCNKTKKAIVVDPVLDFNFDSGRTSNENVNKLIHYIKEQNLHLEWILETHVSFFGLFVVFDPCF